MEEDTKPSPLDSAYLDFLIEPWKSIARRLIPKIEDTKDNGSLASASARLERFELDIRSQFLEIVFQEDDDIVMIVGGFWRAALDLCLHLVHHASQPSSTIDPRYEKILPRRVPLLLIEDSLDALPVADMKKFWAMYVEPSLSRSDELLGDLLWKSSTTCNLPFLRICNHFLKLLETTPSDVQGEWKGRILTALAKGFSVADRSALKLWGTFHSTNINDFESEETYETKHEEANSITSVTDEFMNYNLYESFWSLQSDFASPNRIQVATFMKKLKTVIEAMESASSFRTTNSNTTPAPDSVRFMTSSLLLPTQLASREFRASVCAQLLIVGSHLSSESAALAKALAPCIARAKKILQQDNGVLYHLLVESILDHREDIWRRWKKEKCPVSAFAPKELPEKTVESPRSKAKNALMAGSIVGSDALLEQSYDPLKTKDILRISEELKKTVPGLQEHLEPYVEALDPESGIEAEYHPGNDALFSWRAMRLYAKHELSMLKQCRKPEDLERMTRQLYLAKGQKIPGEMPPEVLLDDESEESEKDDNSIEVEDVQEKEQDDENGDGSVKLDEDVNDGTGEDDERRSEQNVEEKADTNVDDESKEKMATEEETPMDEDIVRLEKGDDAPENDESQVIDNKVETKTEKKDDEDEGSSDESDSDVSDKEVNNNTGENDNQKEKVEKPKHIQGRDEGTQGHESGRTLGKDGVDTAQAGGKSDDRPRKPKNKRKDRKRKRMKGEENGGRMANAARGPPGGRRDERWADRSGNRSEGPPGRGRGRPYDGPGPSGGDRRDVGRDARGPDPPSRRRDDAPHQGKPPPQFSRGGPGRFDDRPPPARPGQYDSSRRHDENGRPRTGGVGGDGNRGDRRDDHRRGGGRDYRGGRR